MSNCCSRALIAIVSSGLFVTGLCGCQQPVSQKQEKSNITAAKAIPILQAKTLRRYIAQEADQGVAVDLNYFYAVDNFLIAKYSKQSGDFINKWEGTKEGPIQHLNSCYINEAQLLCANSNYPEIPMASSIETFNTSDLSHTGNYSLGVRDEGSLTWFSPYEDGWIAGFAHYSGEKGLPHKDTKYSSVITFDDEWRRTGGWMLPKSVTSRMSPYAASGGQIGPNGLLYLTGHDLPEMYALALPTMGPKLMHISTIELESRGQAFSFDPSGTGIVFAIDREKNLVLEIQLPNADVLPVGGKRFSSGR